MIYEISRIWPSAFKADCNGASLSSRKAFFQCIQDSFSSLRYSGSNGVPKAYYNSVLGFVFQDRFSQIAKGNIHCPYGMGHMDINCKDRIDTGA
jgi:hypothetical protein